ncbi:MAG: hypothetical protein FWG22_05775 [Prolixibacteraceae bacterium]|nr:hypothetical protein [Prolixibacteraceae bacterium]
MDNKEFLKYYQNPQLLNSATLLKIKALTNEYPAFDTGWALWLRNLKNLEQGYDEKLQQTAIRIADRKWLKKFMEAQVEIPMEIAAVDYFQLAEYLSGNGHETTESPATEPSENMRLIEDFLQNPDSQRMETESTSTVDPEEIEKRSATDDDDIITETFAEILLSQNKFERAIDIFDKLSLKFPEKSIYFAARVKEVKKMMNF